MVRRAACAKTGAEQRASLHKVSPSSSALLFGMLDETDEATCQANAFGVVFATMNSDGSTFRGYVDAGVKAGVGVFVSDELQTHYAGEYKGQSFHGFYLYNYTTGHAARRAFGAPGGVPCRAAPPGGVWGRFRGLLDALGSACDRAKAASTASYRASP